MEQLCNGSAADHIPRNCSSQTTGATILSPTIMFLAGVFGNILALYTLYKTRTDVRSTKFYTLVTGLAWTDLLGILTTSPSVLAAYVNGLQWVGGDAHCRFHGFAMTCFGLATPLIICAMAVERFLALKCVFFYSSKCRNGSARGLVLILWLMVIWYGILPLFGFGSFEKQYPGTWCFLDFHSKNLVYNIYAYVYASVNLLLLVVMLACNGYVMVTLCHTRFRRNSDSAGRGSVSEKSEMLTTGRPVKSKLYCVESQMIALMFALTSVFFVCWAPLMIQIIVTMATGKANYLLDLAAVRLASLNQTLDPWLYIIFRRSLITKLKNCGRRACNKCGIVKNDTSNNDDLVNIIKPVKDYGYQKDVFNNNPEFCINDGEKEIPNNFEENISQPDVMLDTNRSNNSNHLQLPDVTNTGATGYVYSLHFGRKMSDSYDDGIYVKISFLSQKSTVESDNRKTNDVFRRDLTRTNSCPSDGHPQTAKMLTRNDTEDNDTRTTEVVTKETSADNSSSYGAHPHSEMIPDVLHDQEHKGLRKTKSNV